MDSDESGPVYRFGDYRLDTAQRTLTRRGADISLTPTLFEILRMLVEHAGRILDKERFMERVWAGRVVEDGNLARNVSTLRKLLEDDPQHPRYIETIARRGYRFVAEVEVGPPASTGGPLHAAESAQHASRPPHDVPAGPPDDGIESMSRIDVRAGHGTRRRLVPGSGSGPARWTVAAGCLALLGAILAAPHIGSGPDRSEIGSIIVLPFVNLSGDSGVRTHRRCADQ
jgi:DNA-binding winged helix-turn-helix (wHTH) protein